MKLSPATIQVLNSMAKINPDFSCKAGNIITTRSGSSFKKATECEVLIRAEVPDVFPKDWYVHPLSDFLKLIAMSPNTELEFEDRFIRVRQDNVITNYPYSIPHQMAQAYMSKSAPTTSNEAKPIVAAMTCVLTSTMIKHIIKAASTLGLSTFEINEEFIEIKNNPHTTTTPIQKIMLQTEGDVLTNRPFLFNVSVLNILDNANFEVSLTKDSGVFKSLGEANIVYQIQYQKPVRD